MKKYICKIKLMIYPLVLIAMIFAVFEYANISIVGATGNCCTYGIDCKGEGTREQPTLRCCFPWQEAPCSESKRNYCRATC